VFFGVRFEDRLGSLVTVTEDFLDLKVNLRTKIEIESSEFEVF
jgi:hypothetical protein